MTKKDIDNYQNLREECCRYQNKIGDLCKLYFEQKLKDGDWQQYSGWSLSGDTLVISYSYTDYYSNTDAYTEFADIKIDLNEFLKFSKKI